MNSDTPALLCRRARQSDLPGLLALIADDVLGKNRDHGDPDQACYVQAFHAIDQDANQLLLVAELAGQQGGSHCDVAADFHTRPEPARCLAGADRKCARQQCFAWSGHRPLADATGNHASA